MSRPEQTVVLADAQTGVLIRVTLAHLRNLDREDAATAARRAKQLQHLITVATWRRRHTRAGGRQQPLVKALDRAQHTRLRASADRDRLPNDLAPTQVLLDRGRNPCRPSTLCEVPEQRRERPRVMIAQRHRIAIREFEDDHPADGSNPFP